MARWPHLQCELHLLQVPEAPLQAVQRILGLYALQRDVVAAAVLPARTHCGCAVRRGGERAAKRGSTALSRAYGLALAMHISVIYNSPA